MTYHVVCPTCDKSVEITEGEYDKLIEPDSTVSYGCWHKDRAEHLKPAHMEPVQR